MAISVTAFSPKVAESIFNAVKGHSTLARLSGRDPIAFTGNREMVFSLDKEVDIVAENGEKSAGGATITPVTIIPVKFEYGARVSDEFMIASEEDQLDILERFNEGFARKIARGFDIAAMHGLNPRTGLASAVVGTNNFDSAVSQTVTFVAASADANVEAAVALVEANDGDVNGMAMAPAMRSALAALTGTNGKLYPELSWGSNPGRLNGLNIDTNSTVAFGTNTTDVAIVGDFDAFRWGFAKDIAIDVIQYGDPDNTGADLKGHNQVYIRAEAYIGWAILDANAFALIAS